MSIDFKARIAKAKEDAKNGGGGFDEIPFDTYNMRLENAFVNKSKAGNDQVNWDWIVLEGEYEGKKHRSFSNLMNEVGLTIFTQQVMLMERDPEVESLEEIDELVKELSSQHPICTITIYEKKGYRNTKLVDFLGFSEDGEESPQPQAKAEAGVPEEYEAPSIEVGSKLKYKVGDKVITGQVKSIDYDKETLDFTFHKGIPLSDVMDVG